MVEKKKNKTSLTKKKLRNRFNGETSTLTMNTKIHSQQNMVEKK